MDSGNIITCNWFLIGKDHITMLFCQSNPGEHGNIVPLAIES